MKVKVKLGLWKMSVVEKIAKIRFIILSLIGNPWFPTPSPTAATLTTLANNLEAAQLKAKGGGPDDTEAMRIAESKLDTAVTFLAAYIETTANADPVNAVQIALSSGMELKAKGGNVVKEFSAKPTGIPGEVLLTCPGITPHGTYEFQMCTDPSNEANFVRIYIGTKHTFLVTGLKLGANYFFRACAVNKDGIRPWSAIKSLFIN